MNSGIVIIKTAPNKKARIIPWPEEPWFKGLNDNQRQAYIASLDHLDKAATRVSATPKRASEV